MTDSPRPAYRPLQDGLRAVGSYLDRMSLRLVSLAVVEGGIFVTTSSRDLHFGGQAELLTHDDLRDLMQGLRVERGGGNAPRTRDRFFVSAYEDFLRALGAIAAERGWTALRLTRVGDIAVLHFGPLTSRGEIVVEAVDVDNIINNAFEQRATRIPLGHLGPMPEIAPADETDDDLNPGTAGAGAARPPVAQPRIP